MKLTEALKKYLAAHHGVAPDADDAQYSKALADALVSGAIDHTKLAELVAEKATDPKAVLEDVVTKRVQAEMAPLKTMLAELLARPAVPPVAVTATAPVAQTPPPATEQKSTPLTADDVMKVVEASLAKAQGGNGPTPMQLFGQHGRAASNYDGVRVKSVVEKYAQERRPLLHSADSKHHELRGQQVRFHGSGEPMSAPSQADYAQIGAYLKWQVLASGQLPCHMQDDDWELVKHLMHNERWTGCLGGDTGRGVDLDNVKLTKTNTEALINDAASGGQNAIPVIFEQAIMMVPLLYGELFPLVNVINVNSGTTVRTQRLLRPEFTDGTEEQVSIALTDITNFISYIDTVVHTAVAATEIGLDFEQDSLPDFGAQMVMSFGEKAKQWLDKKIAIGGGTSDPEGIFNAASTVTVNAKNPGGGVVIQDAEALFFGVNKAFQTSRGEGRNVFVGNEVNYQRLRAVPAWAGSNLRVDNSPYNSYTVKGIPYKVSTDIANNQLAFANLAWYYMVRRLGASVRVETAGKTLALQNLKLFVVRMRYGGRLRQGGAAAIMADLPG